MTGEGMEELFDAVREAREEYETDYKPELEKIIAERVRFPPPHVISGAANLTCRTLTPAMSLAGTQKGSAKGRLDLAPHEGHEGLAALVIGGGGQWWWPFVRGAAAIRARKVPRSKLPSRCGWR